MEPETATRDSAPVGPSSGPASAVQSSLDGFIRENTGKLSSSRLLILLWGGGVFLIWAVSSLRAEMLQPIPESVITVVGVLIGAKTVQRFGE
ncbi:MAG: hypothetical protein HC857_18045 [Synechococcales cyanobacterium RU_4_20]|nr:hypothetical protein [Synechococcales cyanobacterium RU_4_20]NJR67890.1 hypothetical protein [Synechococcales cyanobacterium CRU_2_2]